MNRVPAINLQFVHLGLRIAFGVLRPKPQADSLVLQRNRRSFIVERFVEQRQHTCLRSRGESIRWRCN